MSISVRKYGGQAGEKYYERLLSATGAALSNLDPREFKPGPGTVLAKEAPPITRTKGGLHIPDAYAERQSWGIVVATNVDDKTYQPGDIVIFRFQSGVTVYFDTFDEGSQKFVILQYEGRIGDDILGGFPGKVDISNLPELPQTPVSEKNKLASTPL